MKVTFRLSHIDRQPLGDITGSLVSLIVGNAGVDFLYRHRCDGRSFTLDTREIREEVGDIPINNGEVIKFIRGYIQEGLSEIGTNA
jgi:hypothetical protein